MRVSKRLSANDLGLTGSHQAGLHIPKDPATLGLFPALDSSRLNPDCELSLYAPAVDAHWPARFVFYNGRHHGRGTRSEYRLTKISGLLREIGAEVGDNVQFTLDGQARLILTLHKGTDLEPTGTGHVSHLRNGWTMIIEDGDD